MRIVCPACAAAYEVPDGRLLPGRVVRCARCETDWAPLLEEVPVPVTAEPVPPPPPTIAEATVEPVPEPEVSAPVAAAGPRQVVPAGAPQGRAALAVAWVVSLGVVAAALWFGYSARETVMRTWPPSIRAYAALGLAGSR